MNKLIEPSPYVPIPFTEIGEVQGVKIYKSRFGCYYIPCSEEGRKYTGQYIWGFWDTNPSFYKMGITDPYYTSQLERSIKEFIKAYENLIS